MGLDQYLVYYTATNFLKAGAQVVGKLSYIGHKVLIIGQSHVNEFSCAHEWVLNW